MNREQLAELYEAHHRRGDKYGFIYAGETRGRTLAGWIGENKRVLDVGCRDGSLTRFFATNNRVTGLDIDRDALELCAKATQAETRWGDVTEGLPFDDAAFDVVCSAEILEHLPYPDQLVAEVSRVLKPGGLYVGSVPNAFRVKNRLRFLMGREFETDPTHLHWFSPGGLRHLLAEHFRPVDITFLASRFLWLHRRWLGNDMCFRAEKRARPADR